MKTKWLICHYFRQLFQANKYYWVRKTECVKILCSLLSCSFRKNLWGFLFLFFCRFLDPGVFIFCAQTQTAVIFLFIYFSQFCLFISLTDFWGKNKKWLIPVIVILAVIMVPLCIWWGIEDAKKEKKREQKAEKSKD